MRKVFIIIKESELGNLGEIIFAEHEDILQNLADGELLEINKNRVTGPFTLETK